jgi:PAS domain S-box-containing protein
MTAGMETMRDRQQEIARLVAQLAETERAIHELTGGELDAVVDPETAAPLLLSRAQRALVRSEARYRDLISRCPALVCELSPGGQTVFANEAVRSLLGYDPSEIVTRNWWDTLVPTESHGDALRLMARARKGNVTGYHLPLRARNGRILWILWNTANRYTISGELDRIVAFGIDVTDRKAAEDAGRKLEEARLARTRAEAANRAKTDFLAVMSHELRTPLNSIGGYAELLEMGLRGPMTDEQIQDLHKIQRSQRHLLGLINDLMNFAKLETGHVSLEVGAISVNEILAVIDALTQTQAAAKGLIYTYERCEPTLTVWADREKVHQILINLVTNAIKFTPSGGTIEVTCGVVEDEIHFLVTDSGLGIPAEKLPVIFDPFVQVKTGLTREHDGVGLGLAISRDLARMMNGDLTVISVPDHGSTFTLRLPRQAPAGE